MGLRSWGRLVALIGAALIVAGCGQTGSAEAVPQGATAQPKVHRAASGALLYVAFDETVYVFKYPTLKQVETFKPPSWLGFNGASNPNDGDMCFDNYSTVYLFAHGATKPYASVGAPSETESFDCALDPVTKNLAVTYSKSGAGNTWVDVYSNPSGSPTKYSSSAMNYIEYAAYDADGDLFVDGQAVAGYGLLELPKGGSAFITLSTGSFAPSGPLAWDGQYMTITEGRNIYRFQTSGSSITIVGETATKDSPGFTHFAIQGDQAVGKANEQGSGEKNSRWFGVWHYPQGGRPFTSVQLIRKNKKDIIGTILVSVAPSH